MKVIADVDEKKMIPRSVSSGSSNGAPPKYHMVYTHLGVSCVDHNSSRIGAIAHNSNRNNFSRNSSSNSSTMLLPHCHSRLPSGRDNNFPPATFHASTGGRWVTLLENATSQSKETHRERRHPWSTSRWANRRVLHHKLATPTTPPRRIFPWEKKC
jgi:hypothetical protein